MFIRHSPAFFCGIYVHDPGLGPVGQSRLENPSSGLFPNYYELFS
jgi:hypothetical protein